MFARGKAIREAKKAEILAKATQQARQETIKQERKRYNAKMRAWAKERGIPENELPFADEED